MTILDLIDQSREIADTDIIVLEEHPDLQPHEKVLGVVSKRAQRFYTVVARLERETLKELLALSTVSGNAKACTENRRQISLINEAFQLFWYQITEEVGPVHSSATIQIRRNWEVVEMPPLISVLILNGDAFMDKCQNPDCHCQDP